MHVVVQKCFGLNVIFQIGVEVKDKNAHNLSMTRMLAWCSSSWTWAREGKSSVWFRTAGQE